MNDIRFHQSTWHCLSMRSLEVEAAVVVSRHSAQREERVALASVITIPLSAVSNFRLTRMDGILSRLRLAFLEELEELQLILGVVKC